MTMLRAAALFTAAAVVLTGCGGGGGPEKSPPASGSSARQAPASADPSLLAKAKLQRCPEVHRASEDSGGARLPSVTLRCLDSGPAVPMARLRGPAVVNLWATWCEPCRTELPMFQRLHTKAGDNVQVLGVDSADRSRDAALGYAADIGLRYASVYDPEGRVMTALKAGKGLPVTVFVDSSGAIVYRKIGPYTSYGELAGDVETHLGVRQ